MAPGRSRSRSVSPVNRRDSHRHRHRVRSRSKSKTRSRSRDRRDYYRERERGDRNGLDRQGRHSREARHNAPVIRARKRSRTRSRSPRRFNDRSRSPKRRRRSRTPPRKSSAKGGAVPKYLLEKPEITDKDLEGKTEEEQEMMKLMGFGSFDTTKGQHVPGNDVYAVHVIQKRKYRQYMNRKGGFNRPLDFVA